eukprot:TRINITY_DN3626_c0_g1_i2.p2 TRINITY_DN3626_c0_g1~~TRINITY_DN3626_c0_g1_i2.p2  ORF type:complete len:115 (-),score=21.37 TRINITY_DN3626_c0_g1_i2:550-894(-)
MMNMLHWRSGKDNYSTYSPKNEDKVATLTKDTAMATDLEIMGDYSFPNSTVTLPSGTQIIILSAEKTVTGFKKVTTVDRKQSGWIKTSELPEDNQQKSAIDALQNLKDKISDRE